jgi:hypothetical protein
MTAIAEPPFRSMTVTLRVPNDVVLAQDEVQAGVVALLFHDGRVSHRQACDLLGLDRRSFDGVLATHGFAPSEAIDPAEEIAAARAW